MGFMTSWLTLTARLSGAAALAGACALLTACGSTPAPGAAATRTITVQASPSPSPHANAAATSPAAPSGPAGCLSSALQAQLGASQGTAGTFDQWNTLAHTQSASCMRGR